MFLPENVCGQARAHLEIDNPAITNNRPLGVEWARFFQNTT
jgi:hypothetical protein